MKLLLSLGANWKSGLTVALVSIPLSVSLAVASHASPVMGIVTAIWAGLIASLFGGSNYNVVGPTGALSGILAAYAMLHGAQTFPMLAIIAGVLIGISYFFHLERYLVFVPGSAIHGFTLGVAFIIGLNQLNFALGLVGLPGHEKFIENVFESLKNLPAISLTATGVFLIAFFLLFFFKKFTPRFPGAILVAPLGILFGWLNGTGIISLSLPTLYMLYPDIHLELLLPHVVSITASMWSSAFAIALVAILETMISAKIADGMTGTNHHKQNEMRGLALANIASGIMGGMPATAALARTSLNVKTGATSKISATISSGCIAIISILLLNYYRFIPLAVIAAILVYVSVQMVEREHFARMWKYDKKNWIIALMVALVTIFIDPIFGILFGVGVSCLLLLERLSRGQFDLVMNDAKHHIIGRASGESFKKLLEGSDTVVYSIKGLLCSLNSEAHLERFRNHFTQSHNIILRLRSVYYIDIDGIEAIDEIIRSVQVQGKNIYLTSVSPIIEELLKQSTAYRQLKHEGKVFQKSIDALRYLGFTLPH